MTLTAGAGIAIDARSQPKPGKTSVSMAGAKPVKILHIINDLAIGGAEIMLYRLLSEKSRQRFNPVVISLMDRGSLRQRIEELGIPVYTARMKRGLPTPASIWRLIRLVREIKPDLIQGWLYHGSLAAQIGSFSLPGRIPALWSIHCSIYSLSFEKKLTAAVVRICALLSRLAAWIIFVSRTSQAQHKALGYDVSKSCVVPNGIDTSLFAPSIEAKTSVRSELGIPREALLIGVIGRYHAMKDHANFLRAAALIATTHPEVHFLLAGRELDHENRALAQLIRELRLEDRTHLVGERTDIARLVAALDIFCLSSSHGESFPIIVGEAMSSAVPCVVTDVGDSAWILSGTGRVTPPRDAPALAAACVDLLDLGQQGRETLGQAARARVVDLFSLSTVVAEYEALYETMLARAGASDKRIYQTVGEA
ncbi:MAG: glycosyl transferase group 1 [Acidobacteria bacterium]|nr:glycosyl transferase group 1 [Acidobacteriota bacterium]